LFIAPTASAEDGPGENKNDCCRTFHALNKTQEDWDVDYKWNVRM
jgi:hypothetical protein